MKWQTFNISACAWMVWTAAWSSSLVSGTLDHECAERETGFKPRAPQSCDSAAGRDPTKEAGVLSSAGSRSCGAGSGSQEAAACWLPAGAGCGSCPAPRWAPGISASPLLSLSRDHAEWKRVFKYLWIWGNGFCLSLQGRWASFSWLSIV